MTASKITVEELSALEDAEIMDFYRRIFNRAREIVINNFGMSEERLREMIYDLFPLDTVQDVLEMDEIIDELKSLIIDEINEMIQDFELNNINYRYSSE